MEIKTFTENGRVPVTVIHVDGDLDSSTYEAFQTQVDDLIDTDARFILLDLSHTKFVSSAGLRVLLSAAKRLSSKLRVCGLNETVQEVFDISGFTSIFEVYDSEQLGLDG